MARVLVIDADAALRANLTNLFAQEGHDVESASSGASGLVLAKTSNPEVIVFDFGSGDGVELCRALGDVADGPRPKLLVLTAQADEATRVAAFEAGVDDFVAKPHSARELLLRMRALMRSRNSRPPADAVTVGALRVERASRRVFVDARSIDLTRREFDLLLSLADRVGRVQTREILLSTVWGDGGESERVVDTTVKRVRKKLGSAAPAIRTVRGVGYKLDVE